MINTLPRHQPAIRMNEFTQEKSYKCNHCGKCFSFSSILEAMNEYTRELNLKSLNPLKKVYGLVGHQFAKGKKEIVTQKFQSANICLYALVRYLN